MKLPQPAGINEAPAGDTNTRHAKTKLSAKSGIRTSINNGVRDEYQTRTAIEACSNNGRGKSKPERFLPKSPHLTKVRQSRSEAAARARASATRPLDFINELIVDNFAGGGGASTGIELGFKRLGLDRKVAIAINHDGEALAMHQANHPECKHYREDVFDIHPGFVTGQQPIGLAWFSPDCKHHSRAKGGKPRDQKIRGLAWITLKWAALQFPRMIMLENVIEFADWGPLLDDGRPDKTHKGRTFQAFVSALSTGIAPDHPDLPEIHDTLGGDFPISRLLTGLGYHVEWRTLRACDYGAPTIRKRLILKARRDGLPIIWAEHTHGDPNGEAVKTGKLLPWRTAADCIDFSIPCPSIFERKRPLANATLRRIARGLRKFVIDSPKPFFVDVAHGETGAKGSMRWGDGTRSVDAPMNTIVASGNQGLVETRIAPFVSTYYGDKRTTDARGGRIDSPIGTQTAENRHALVAATLIQSGYGERAGQEPRAPGLQKPLGTVVAGGAKHALVAAFLAKHYSGAIGSDMVGPLGTVTGVDHHSYIVAHITKFRSDSVGSPINEPLHTVTAGGDAARPSTGNVMGLVTAHIVGIDNQSSGASAAWEAKAPLTTITAEARHALVTSNLIKLRGDNVGSNTDGPLHTISAQGQHHAEVRAFLIEHFGSQLDAAQPSDSLSTLNVNSLVGLVYVDGVAYQIVDIGLRMLTPRELARAQGFPDSYIIDPEFQGKPLTKSSQVRMIGNSVCPDLAAAEIHANFSHEVTMYSSQVARRINNPTALENALENTLSTRDPDDRLLGIPARSHVRQHLALKRASDPKHHSDADEWHHAQRRLLP